ncbi:MAG: type IV pilus assembly protein PilM [Actinomycetota bacterium]
MAKTTIGLDIGTSAVRAAEIRGRDPGVLVRFAQLSLPAGAVVGGEVADSEAVASVIRDLWRQGEFKGKRVALGVASQSVVVRQVDVPKMEESELASALRYQVQDYIPISIDDALLDFMVLEEFESEENAPMLRVLAVAAHKDMVAQMMAVLDRAGLEPVVVDLSPLAAVRALVEPVPSILQERAAEAIVDIGAGVTDVIVHEAGKPRFIRILPSGGNDITNALVTELGLSVDDAEAQKRAVGLQPEGAPIDAGAATVIEARARAFIDDVRRSLDFYQSGPDLAKIARVLVIGGGSQLPRLAERLATALRLPVEQGNAFARVKVSDDIRLTDEQLDTASHVATTVIGLALEP